VQTLKMMVRIWWWAQRQWCSSGLWTSHCGNWRAIACCWLSYDHSDSYRSV